MAVILSRRVCYQLNFKPNCMSRMPYSVLPIVVGTKNPVLRVRFTVAVFVAAS